MALIHHLDLSQMLKNVTFSAEIFLMFVIHLSNIQDTDTFNFTLMISKHYSFTLQSKGAKSFKQENKNETNLSWEEAGGASRECQLISESSKQLSIILDSYVAIWLFFMGKKDDCSTEWWHKSVYNDKNSNTLFFLCKIHKWWEVSVTENKN